MNLSIGSLPDGDVELCVRGVLRANGKLVAIASSFADYKWRKDVRPPQAWSFTAPMGTINDDTPTIVWTAAELARSYTISIFAAPGCRGRRLHQSEIAAPATTADITPALAEGTYYLCGSATNDVGSTSVSNNDVSFTVDLDTPLPLPGAFHVLAPSGTVTTATPMAAWEASSDAETYDLTIATDVSCTAVVQTHVGLTGTSHALTALTDGDYFACVTATNVSGSIDATNNGLPFNVLATAPSPFAILGPSGTLHVPDFSVTWEAASSAVSYDLRIGLDSTCTIAVVTRLGLTSTTSDVTLADGAYYTCVTARSAGGQTTTASNDGLAFTIDTAAPGPFAIVSPTGSINDATPLVTWTPSVFANTYSLRIGSEAGCATPVIDVSNLTDTFYSVGAALSDGDYFICVTAINNVATTAASNDGQSFIVDTAVPQAFTIEGPSGATADNAPTVTWTASANADSYDLAIGVETSCTVPVQLYPGLTSLSQDLAALADGSYYICIAAINANGALAATNNGLNFRVVTTAPSAFAITGPTGTVTDPTPTVTWQAATGAVSYNLDISAAAADPACSDIVAEYIGLTTTAHEIDALAPGSYTVCLDAIGETGLVTTATNNALAFAIAAPGPDVYHHMFVTQDSYQVGVGGFFGPNARPFADYECTFSAWNAGFLPDWDGTSTVYTAFMSHSGMASPNAVDRIDLVGEVRNSIGGLVWQDPSNYLSDPVINTWAMTEWGGEPANAVLWTGSNSGGMASADCNEWTNSIGSGEHGDSSSLSFGGVSHGCSGGGHFICFGPPEPVPGTGAAGITLKRNSPSLLNVGFNSSYFWDGREKNLEAQARLPIQTVDEMNQDLDELEKEHYGPLLIDETFYRLGFSLDKGPGFVTGRTADDYRFRTPWLRNVARTEPFMPAGSHRNLDDVLFYDLRGVPNFVADVLSRDLESLPGVAFDEIPDLTAFLEALSV